MGMLGATAMPPDVLQAALRDIKAGEPACFGVNFIARFSGIEHIEVCVAEKAPVVAFFWDDPPDEWLSRLRAAGSHVWFQSAAWTKRTPLSDGATKRSSCKAARLAATTAPRGDILVTARSHRCSPVRACHRFRRHCRWRTVAAALAPRPDAGCGWIASSASFEANAHPQYERPRLRCGVGIQAQSSDLRPEFPERVDWRCATASCRNGGGRDHPRLRDAFRKLGGAVDWLRPFLWSRSFP